MSMGSLFDLSAWISELPSDCPIDDEIAAWHLTPTQHVVEWGISTAVFTYFLYTCWKREEIHVKLKRRAERHYPRFQQLKQAIPPSRLTDILVALALIASLSLIFYHKWMKSRVWFMTQPCYALHTLLLVIMLFPRGSVYGSLLFNIYLHLLFSPFLGLVGANTSVYKQFLEYENWFVEHALLLITPLVFIYTHRFVLVRGFNFLLMSFSIEVLYHSLILLPGSFISGLNLNYVMCPPAGLLSSFNSHYRWVMTLIFCPVLMILIRYGLVESFIRLVYANAYLDDVEINPSVVEKNNKNDKTVTQTTKLATTERNGNSNTNTSTTKKRIEIEYENEDNNTSQKIGVTTRSASLKKRSKRADD